MKKILLVEDKPFYRKVMEYILIKEGYEVVSCSSGDEALNHLGKAGFLLVVTDYRMGRVSGLDVAKAAASSDPPIPVFVVTAYSDILIRGLAGKEVTRVFNKPISLTALFDAIKTIETSSPPRRADGQPSYSKGGHR